MKPRNIFKFLNGNTLWYNNLIGKDFDVNKYVYGYNTSELVDGDMSDTIFKPWASPIAGYDKGRYVPTTGFGNFGEGNKHYIYTERVENQPYYKKFGKDLLDESGNFTPMGLEWAKAVDALIPQSNHQARFFDDNGKLRTSWYSKDNDAHGRAPKVYNNLRDYVNYVRNDLILGARHNVFLNKGKRYFYKDKDGVEHWVDPELIKNYNVSENPVRSTWNNDHTVYWDDYELTGPSSGEPLKTGSSIPGARIFKDPPIDWNKLKEGFLKIAPNLLSAGRLAYSLDTNKKMLDELLAANKPQLQGSYHTYHQVTGDEASKLAYYRRAALGQTRASRPFTSDADRQMAYLMEARRVGDEARALGDIIDNQEIRRTSELSKQHSDANVARDNQIANSNYLSLLQSQAQKHLLKNNYLAANYSSWNNYLLGLETRMNQRQGEKQALEDLIYALDSLNRLLNDSNYQDLYNKMNDAYNEAIKRNTDANGYVNYTAASNDPAFKQALLEFKNKLYQLQRQLYVDMLNRRSYFAKDGMKFSYKKKDDLLYKTARDTVEHFRKMAKMSDDSMLKSFKKPLNLIKPPKSTTRKMLTGGIAPFIVYTPAPLGGETTTATNTNSAGVSTGKTSSSTKKEKDSTLDVIKDLFKNLEGLPSDVNHVYQAMLGFLERSKIFGTEIDSNDLASMFLQLMHQINNIKFSKSLYDAALKQATDMDALDEFAVTSDGRFIVQDKEGNLSQKSWKEIKESGEYTPLTNNNLLNIRAYDMSGKYILGNGDNSLLTIVNGGVGMSKIADFIKNHIPNIASSEKTIEGYTRKQSQQILKGFEQILQDAPDGDYHWSQKTEDLKEQMKMAFAYINSILPKNMRAVIKAHADINGTTPDIILQTILGAENKTVNDLKITAVTGKAAKDANGNSKTTEGDIKSNPIMLMLLEQGGIPKTWELITRDSNIRMSVNGTFYSQIPKINEDMSVDKMLSESGLLGVLDSKYGITFGDLNIDPSLLKDIMYSNTGGMIVTLPCKIVNGHKEVNLGVRETYEKAVQEIESKGFLLGTLEFYFELGKILKEKGLSNLVDANGYPDKSKFGLFLVVEAYTTDKIKNLDKNSLYIEKVYNPDDELEQRLIKALSTNKDKNDYPLDINYWLWGDDVYRGTMFIPLTNNLNASINAWGDNVKINEARDLENKFLNFNKASTMKSSNSNILNETE